MAIRVLVFLALAVAALPAEAQQPVTLRFDNGRVWLRTQNASIPAILAEWARLGGATIVNGDRVTGAPITLELTNVPERQALDVVLRNVAGYMLGPRRAGRTGASAFDRIMILPTSAAPKTPPPATAVASGPGRQAPPPRPVPFLRPQQSQDGGNTDAPDTSASEDAGNEEPPATAAGPSPTNPFGMPAGASAKPGVIAPAPRPQPAQPHRVE